MIRFVSLIPNPRERYGDAFSPKLLDRLVARAIKPSMTSPTPHGESEQPGFGYPLNKINGLGDIVIQPFLHPDESQDLVTSISQDPKSSLGCNRSAGDPPPPASEANEKKNPLFFNKNNTLARHCEEPPIYWGDVAIHTPIQSSLRPNIFTLHPDESQDLIPLTARDPELNSGCKKHRAAPSPTHRREQTIDEAFSSIESVRY